ncbi:hypothetical protein [Methylocaldum sp. GT1BB]|uniref:hypothetical protein n=1 Tax=Methylocaldum sp. GT1BB TaxID=3438963 RepID=UPI003DA1B689
MAEEAKESVTNGEKPADYSEVWSALKKELKDLSHGKCWYCEARQIRSDNAVDHFRPKAKYPWLAFSVRNFRFSCTFCNSRRTNPETGEVEGKGDFFPLLDGCSQATCAEELDAERPVLLDPCSPRDPGLLDFRADGTPCPAYSEDSICEYRVRESVKLYHLDHPELNEQRRLLALNLERWVKQADKLHKRLDTGDMDIENAYLGFMEDLAQALEDSAELSIFARRILKMHREKPCVEMLLDCV